MPDKKQNSQNECKLTWPTIQRLSEYLIILEEFTEKNREFISSSELAEIYSNTPSQVRQDIFRLPRTGRTGQGYRVKELAAEIRKVLNLDKKTALCIVGCGKLGMALAQHVPFSRYQMKLAAVFDVSPSIVGNKIDGLKILDISGLESTVREKNIELAALCVPPGAAQELTDRLVSAKIKGILNFTRHRLKVPPSVAVNHTQIICSFMQLSYMSRNMIK